MAGIDRVVEAKNSRNGQSGRNGKGEMRKGRGKRPREMGWAFRGGIQTQVIDLHFLVGSRFR